MVSVQIPVCRVDQAVPAKDKDLTGMETDLSFHLRKWSLYTRVEEVFLGSVPLRSFYYRWRISVSRTANLTPFMSTKFNFPQPRPWQISSLKAKEKRWDLQWTLKVSKLTLFQTNGVRARGSQFQTRSLMEHVLPASFQPPFCTNRTLAKALPLMSIVALSHKERGSYCDCEAWWWGGLNN